MCTAVYTSSHVFQSWCSIHFSTSCTYKLSQARNNYETGSQEWGFRRVRKSSLTTPPILQLALVQVFNDDIYVGFLLYLFGRKTTESFYLVLILWIYCSVYKCLIAVDWDANISMSGIRLLPGKK